jgi:DNA polymerase
MGLPLSLEKVGAVLKLQNQKMKEGKDLIRYFCQPCKPTKTNGGRTRNLPQHDGEKWILFKSYNQRDVEVEMAIKKKLSRFPVPEFVWEEYHRDQEINDRGIQIDPEFVRNAIAFDERSKADLTAAMQRLTGLENPNSVAQLKEWLSLKGVKADSLGKKDVAKIISELSQDSSIPTEVPAALKLRLHLAKSSVKKYQAMQNAACTDDRCAACSSSIERIGVDAGPEGLSSSRTFPRIICRTLGRQDRWSDPATTTPWIFYMTISRTRSRS